MGIVRRQSVLATTASYLGGGLGFVNKVVLFTRILNLDGGELGLANLLIEIASLFAQFAMLGIGNSTLRFFPYFEDEKQGHHGILLFGLVVTLLGSLLAVGLLYLFQDDIARFSSWKRQGDLLVEYYAYLFPLVGAMAVAYLLTAYLRSRYRIAGPTFIREVVLKLLVTLTVTAYALDWVDFPRFVALYTLVNCSLAVLMLAYTAWTGELHLFPRSWQRLRQYALPMLRHGLYVVLGGLSFLLVLKLDYFMLYFFEGLKAVGIYTTIAYFTIVMEYPYRALVGITSPQVAEMWKNRDIRGMHALYKRTSLLTFLVAMLLFCGIWINLDNIFALMKNPEFATGRYVFLLLGGARVIHMLTGLNATILVTSRAFRYDLLFNLLLLLLAFGLNYWLIPRYGINGAALATAISMVAYNLLRVGFVYALERIHPFSWSLLAVLGVGVGASLVNLLIPFMHHFLLDMVLRSLIFALLYGGAILALGISPDVQAFGSMLLKKMKAIF